MKVAIIQCNLHWENKNENIEYFDSVLKSIEQGTELVVLPEMFTTGFTMSPQSCVLIEHQKEILEWMQNWCKKCNFAMCGSIAVAESSNNKNNQVDQADQSEPTTVYYNRMYFVYPDGTFVKYDKKHLYSVVGEHKIYKSGQDKQIFKYKQWNICTLICYDLRFPVFSRNDKQSTYDLLIYVASWPVYRINAWDTLLKARAIENMSVVIGVNRIGQDGNNHTYSGHSQIISQLGNNIIEPQINQGIYYATIDKSDLDSTRLKLPFLLDSDDFNLS